MIQQRQLPLQFITQIQMKNEISQQMIKFNQSYESQQVTFEENSLLNISKQSKSYRFKQNNEVKFSINQTQDQSKLFPQINNNSINLDTRNILTPISNMTDILQNTKKKSQSLHNQQSILYQSNNLNQILSLPKLKYFVNKSRNLLEQNILNNQLSEKLPLQDQDNLHQFYQQHQKMKIYDRKNFSKLFKITQDQELYIKENKINQQELDEHEFLKQQLQSLNLQQEEMESVNAKILFGSIQQKLLPLKMKLISEQVQNSVNLRGYKIGKYIKLFNDSIKSEELKLLEKLNLENNQIDSQNFKNIIENVSNQIKILRFGNNNIGFQGIKYFFDSIQLQKTQKFQNLIELDLKDNKLQDKGVKHLLQAIQKLDITKLNISMNLLTDKSTSSLFSFLKDYKKLKELYLSWNYITSQGGIILIKGLNDSQLVVLDLSFNSLGRGSFECGEKLIQVLNKNQNLRHLDLSYNSFKSNECIQIGYQIQMNNYIYGLHFEGKKNFYCNSEGFIKPSQPRKTATLFQKKFISGVKKQLQTNKFQTEFYNSYDNCWICEGWVETKFQVNLNNTDLKIDMSELGPIYLHLDLEQFNPCQMTQDKDKNYLFFIFRMLPPEIIVNYFFTCPKLNLLFLANDQQTSTNLDFKKLNQLHIYYEQELDNQAIKNINLKEQSKCKLIFQKDYEEKEDEYNSSKSLSNIENEQPENISELNKEESIISSCSNSSSDIQTNKNFKKTEKIVYLDSQQDALVKNNKIQLSFKLPQKINKKFTSFSKNIMNSQNYSSLIIVEPRKQVKNINQDEYYQDCIEQQRIIFKKEIQINLKKNFEYDWKQSNIYNLLEKKEHYNQIKQIFSNCYKQIFLTFLNLSCEFQNSLNIFQPMMLYRDQVYSFFQRLKIIDEKKITTQYFNQVFIQINQNNIDFPLNCSQFLQLLYKLFYFSVDQLQQEFKKLFLDGIFKSQQQIEDPQYIRENQYQIFIILYYITNFQRFWQRETIEIISKYQNYLRVLFYQLCSYPTKEQNQISNSNIQSKKLQNYQQEEMSLKYFQFYDFLENNKLKQQFYVANSEILKMFIFSKQLIFTDQLNCQQISLNYEEFQECFSRLINMITFSRCNLTLVDNQDINEQLENNNNFIYKFEYIIKYLLNIQEKQNLDELKIQEKFSNQKNKLNPNLILNPILGEEQGNLAQIEQRNQLIKNIYKSQNNEDFDTKFQILNQDEFKLKNIVKKEKQNSNKDLKNRRQTVVFGEQFQNHFISLQLDKIKNSKISSSQLNNQQSKISILNGSRRSSLIDLKY